MQIYRKKIDDAGVNPDKIKDISDVGKLPFTTKDDLRDSYPFGLFCTPLSQVVRIHASSGTTGNPTVVGYTSQDMDIWAHCLARVMYDVGVRKDDIVQVSHTLACLQADLVFSLLQKNWGRLLYRYPAEILKDS